MIGLLIVCREHCQWDVQLCVQCCCCWVKWNDSISDKTSVVDWCKVLYYYLLRLWLSSLTWSATRHLSSTGARFFIITYLLRFWHYISDKTSAINWCKVLCYYLLKLWLNEGLTTWSATRDLPSTGSKSFIITYLDFAFPHEFLPPAAVFPMFCRVGAKS